MQDNQKNSEPTPENTTADYNPTAKDKAEGDDNITDASVEESTENKRTEQANTTPDKNKLNN